MVDQGGSFPLVHVTACSIWLAQSALLSSSCVRPPQPW